MKSIAASIALVLILTLGNHSAYAHNQESSFVCAQVNPETGECEAWREVDINQRPDKDNPYRGDYLYPPGHPRVPKRTVVPLGSSIMPNGAYAPGLGTSHKPVWEKGTTK